jgi:hypothetical protein
VANVDPELHPDCGPVAFLLGTWRGEGKGEYPTIQPFGYREEVTFGHVGKPFLTYTQRTWALDDGRPLHGEMGYVRPQPGGRVELVVAQGIGVAEISEGTVQGARIDVASRSVGLTGSAKDITAVERSLWVDGDTLGYELRMAAVGAPLTHHLSAELRRS